MPSMRNSPWAKLTTRMIPKIRSGRRRSAHRSPPGGSWRRRVARARLFALVPGAERDPLGPERRELLGPDGDELAPLPLEHVVLHPLVGVLTVLGELHAPPVDERPDRQVHRHHGRPELVELVGPRLVEDDLEDPEAAGGELVAAQRGGARLLLDGLAELALEPLPFGAQRLQAEPGPGLEQREGPVALRAQRLAEVGRTVAGGTGVDERLEEEALLARLAPEEDRVVAAGDVVDDVGGELLELDDDRREVVGGGERVVLGGHLLHAELTPGPLPGRLRHALAVRRVLGEERDLELVRFQPEAGRQMLGDELDVVPAEAGAVDLRAEHGLEPAPGEARIHAGALPVDDVVPRRRLAGRAAERRGVGAGEDLHTLAGDEPVG